MVNNADKVTIHGTTDCMRLSCSADKVKPSKNLFENQALVPFIKAILINTSCFLSYDVCPCRSYHVKISLRLAKELTLASLITGPKSE